ncbi:maltotransferase domain-containing protein, partial [Kitasatospora sp. NE20-6]|uniref:maltotransferase domain-containing protein n=1 Tax=Kitasatospora sp. NE20-6 TaxID=2859066 RepID=UPI0038B3EA70
MSSTTAVRIPRRSAPVNSPGRRVTSRQERPGPGPDAVGRIPVLDVQPSVDGGRRPAKAVEGERFAVTATVFREGHGAVGANVVLRGPRGRKGPWTPMRELAPGTDRWGAHVTAPAPGRWTYTVESWGDPVTTWLHRAGIKVPAGQDVDVTLEEGAQLLEQAADGVPRGAGRTALLTAAADLRRPGTPGGERLAAAHRPEIAAVLSRHPLRELVSASRPMPLQVDRKRALYGAWYEFFPRSEGAVVDPTGVQPPVSGTLRTAAERLPAVAA